MNKFFLSAIIAFSSFSAIADSVYMPCDFECGDLMETDYPPMEEGPHHLLREAIEGVEGIKRTPITHDPILGELYEIDNLILACHEGYAFLIMSNETGSDIVSVLPSYYCN